MDSGIVLIWAPRIFFACMFVLIGIWSLRRKNIQLKYIVWLIVLYLLERITEILLRTHLTKLSLAQLDPSSFTYIRLEALITPSLRAVITQQLVVIVIAAAVWLLIMLYAKKTNYQKIDKADVLIFCFGTLIAGWPNFILYIGLVFVIALIGLLTLALFRKQTSRMIVTPYFAIAGILVIFWGWELSKLVGLYALR